jgi:hypothetical protein
MSEKLEIEIIEDGDGGTQSLSPRDFPNIREFNRALAQLKAEVRAREFDESQATKVRKKALNDQKLQFNEQKQAKTSEIQQTKLTVQEMKARRQLEVAAGQSQRSREAELNRQNRQREIMLRNVLGAINPNSTFQYRMSSLYGLINTAGISANQENETPQQLQQGAFSKLNDIYSVVSGGLRNLFKQASTQFNQPQSQNKQASIQFNQPQSQNVPIARLAQQTAAQQQTNQEDYQPWWMTYKTPAERENKARDERINKLLPTPFGNRVPVPKAGSPVSPQFAQQALVQAMGLKPPPQTLPNLIATPAGMGGGGSVPPTVAGASPAGIPPGGGGIINTILNSTIGRLGLIAAGAFIVKKAFDLLSSAAAALNRRFTKVIEDIRPFSPALIMSGVTSDLRMMQFNRERGRMFGSQLAGYEQSQTSLKIAFEKLIDSLTMPLTNVMTTVNNELARLTESITVLVDILKLISGNMPGDDFASNLAKLGIYLKDLSLFFAGYGPFPKPATAAGVDVGELSSQLAQFLNMPLPPGIQQDQFSFDMGP